MQVWMGTRGGYDFAIEHKISPAPSPSLPPAFLSALFLTHFHFLRTSLHEEGPFQLLRLIMKGLAPFFLTQQKAPDQEEEEEMVIVGKRER